VPAAFDRAIELLRASGQSPATAQVTEPFDLSDTRKEVRREMSAETEEPAETAEETAEAPAAEETADEPAAEETADEPAAEEPAQEGS
jgi:hypothetical protein